MGYSCAIWIIEDLNNRGIADIPHFQNLLSVKFSHSQILFAYYCVLLINASQKHSIKENKHHPVAMGTTLINKQHTMGDMYTRVNITSTYGCLKLTCQNTIWASVWFGNSKPITVMLPKGTNPATQEMIKFG